MTILLILVFAGGYVLVTLEHKIGLDKAGTGLLTGVALWGILFLSGGHYTEHLMADLANTAQIIFFLMGAMAIVELVDLHNGFAAVTRFIAGSGRIRFLLLISAVTFFLSAVLDNLTTAIVMTSVAQKMVSDKKDLAATFLSTSSLIVGTLLLVSVPIVKGLTGLPPFMGMLFALGVFWVFLQLASRGENNQQQGHIASALQRLDLPGLLFFIGILLAVGALGAAGVLASAAAFLSSALPDYRMINFLIGMISAVIDNVPLVAAMISMYDLSVFPADHNFWLLLTYAAGTGGSLLIIGSAAGVVAMGIGGIEFFWYLRRMTLPVFAGYALGFGLLLFILPR